MHKILRQSQKIWNKNGATILTCLGAAGVVATSVMAVKATPKALELIELSTKEKGEELTVWEKTKVAAPVYIPAVALGAATITCIFGANIMNKRTQAALSGAYLLLDQSFKEYRKKVEELYGEDEEKIIRTAIAKDNYEDEEQFTPDDENDDGKTLFFDQFSNRYFRAHNETVLRAEYEINKILSTDGGAALNDYYELVGLPAVDYGDYLGWASAQMYEMYWDGWLYFHHTKVDMDDGMVCWLIDYNEPLPNYDEY